MIFIINNKFPYNGNYDFVLTDLDLDLELFVIFLGNG
jgi:hypothetical protein